MQKEYIKSTGTVTHVYPTTTSSTTTTGGYFVRTASPLIKGDRVRSTNYYNGNSSLKFNGSFKRDRYSVRNGVWRYRHDVMSYGAMAPTWYDSRTPLVRANTNPSGSLINLAIIPSMSNAINEALAGLNDAKINLGATLGELGETTSYLAHRGASLFHALRHIRRGHVVKAFRSLDLSRDPRDAISITRKRKAVSSAWLESRYAVRPLVSDISALADIVDKGLGGDSMFVTGKSKQKSVFVETNEKLYYRATGTITDSWSHNYNIESRVKIVGKVNNVNLTGLKALGLNNPLAVGWELIPFSFVVDWILPIGDFVNALTGPSGLDFVDAYVSHKVKGSSNYRFAAISQPKTPSNGSYRTKRFGSGTIKGEAYRRNALGTFPMPQIPNLSNKMDIPKYIDLGAILTQLRL